MKYKNILILILIIVLAVYLRFWQLGTTPKGFYLDEAALGYNAWSILETGKDEFGKSWPMLFRSFGDFKAPIYVYLLIPIYKILGMSVWSTRLLSAIMGVIGIIFFYLLIKKISQSQKLAVLTTMLLVISPWHLIFCRTSYETNVALSFLIISLWCFYKSKEKRWWLIISGLMATLSFLSYHSERVIVPLIFLGLFLRHRKNLLEKKNIKYLLISVGLVIVVLLPTIKLFTSPGFLSRLNSLSILAKPTETLWNYNQKFDDKNNILFNNRYLLISRQFLSLYTSYFSPRYLFDLGDPGPRNSFPDLATFFGWQLPFLIIGIIFWIKNKDKKCKELLFLTAILLLISPIPSSITQDPYSSIRALPMVMPWMILVGLGMKQMKKKFGGWMKILYFGLIIWSLGRIYLSVFKFNDYYRFGAWDYGTERLVNEIKKIDSNTPILIDTRAEPYSQFLFFTKTDPKTYQENNLEVDEKNYYTEMQRNKIKKIGNVTFRQIDWNNDLTKNQIIVGDNLTFGEEAIKEHCFSKIFEIKGLDNKTILFTGIKTNPMEKNRFNEIKKKFKIESNDCWEINRKYF